MRGARTKAEQRHMAKQNTGQKNSDREENVKVS